MLTAKKIWLIFSPKERTWLFTLIALLLTASLFELIGLALVIPYVNLVLLEETYREYYELSPIVGWMLSLSGDYRVDATFWFVTFYLFKNTMLAAMTFFQQSIIKNLYANIVIRMHHNFMEKPYAFHLNSNTSSIIRSMTYDAAYFGDRVITQSCILLAELFLFTGIVAILTFRSTEALFLMLILALVLGAILAVIKNKLVHWGMKLQQREAEVIRQLQEGFGGIKDVLVSGSTLYFEDEFQKNAQLRAKFKRDRDFTLLMPRFFIETIMMIGMASIMLWMISNGGLQQNFALIAFLAVALVRMLPMSNRIMNSVGTIKSCTQSTNVVFENARFIPSKAAVYNAIENTADSTPFETIDVKALSFSYNVNTTLLNDINLSIRNGEIIGIVGRSGSGKTTMVDVLLGLLKPQTGQILLDGKRNIHHNFEEWQRKIGYVQQNVFMLDNTIKANIAFGLPLEEIDDAWLSEVIGLAKLDRWVASLPDGLNTKVGERGVSISGGQRQRMGIARALYRRPEILILDEATSALDNLTEKQLIADVLSGARKQTVFMIAHRLNTISNCDRIIVLNEGNIVGVGTYKELLDNNSVFQAISYGNDK